MPGPRVLFFGFLGRDKGKTQQGVVHLVCVTRFGPRFFANAFDRSDVEAAEVGRSFLIKPPPAHHRLRAAFFQRRVVEIRVRPRGQNLQRERRWLRQIARDDLHVAGLDPAEQRLQPVDVHRFVQTIVNCLLHQRMVRYLPFAHQVLGARDLVGKDRRHQVFGAHPLQRRGHFLAAAEAGQRKRCRRDPSPTRSEHRRVKQRLDQHGPDTVAV